MRQARDSIRALRQLAKIDNEITSAILEVAANELECLVQSNADLLEALFDIGSRLNICICVTPTGELRNKLTEMNILALQAISNAPKK